MPRVYLEAGLSVANSKLPGFSGSPSEDKPPGDEDIERSGTEPELLIQPDIRPISHEQLVSEVKGIYAGLVMVEAKCIDINERQSHAAQGKGTSKTIHPKDDQWQSLIALHKQLLHEHHDFFLASQHSSASPALSRLATQYAMPARIWRHGIYAFLEVLGHRLPESLEHMLAFIYIAYSMMALLYETIPTFEETWIECLGDLGRYRMAIEDDGAKDKEIWKNVTQFWYKKASEKTPCVGRLYHHLAILARPFTLEQLSLHTRALASIAPFESAQASVKTLFNPITNNRESIVRWSSPLEALFIQGHAINSTRDLVDTLYRSERTIEERKFDELFDMYSYIVKTSPKFRQIGVFAAVANIAALFEYGKAKRRIPTPINTEQPDPAFPKPTRESYDPLPENLVMRGQLYSQCSFPETWFTDTRFGDDERSSEVPSMSQARADRFPWLSRRIASVCLPLPI